MPVLDLSDEDHQREDKGQYHLNGLVDHQEPVSVLSIGNHPADRPEEETGKALKQGGNSHQKRGIGQQQHQPADSHQLHFVADMGKNSADPEQAEVPVLEGTEPSVPLLLQISLTT